MVNFFYNQGGKRETSPDSWLASAYKVTLVSNNLTIISNPDTVFLSAISGAELAGSNFAAGFAGTIRLTFGSKTANVNDTDDQVELDAADSVWTAIDAGTAAAALVIEEKTDDDDSVLVAHIDTGGFPVTTNGGDFTITWANSGVLVLASNA